MYAHPLSPSFTGVFRQQDGCLGKQSYEHNQSHLHIDVIFYTEQLGKQETPRQPEGYGKDDCNRYEKTLIEGTEYKIDKQETNDKDGNHGSALFRLVTGHSRKFVAIPGRKCLYSHLTNRLNYLPRTVTIGGHHIDSYSGEHIKTRQ